MLRFFQILLLSCTLLWSSCERIFRYTGPGSSDSASVDLAVYDGVQEVTLADSSPPCPDGQEWIEGRCSCTSNSCSGCCIDNSCHPEGDQNDSDLCRRCDRKQDPYHWTILPNCVHTLVEKLDFSPVDVDVAPDSLFPIYVAANEGSGHGHLLEVDQLFGQATDLSVGDVLPPIIGLAFYENGAPLLAFSQQGLSCIESWDINNEMRKSFYCDDGELISPQGLDAADRKLAIADENQVVILEGNIDNLTVYQKIGGFLGSPLDVALLPSQTQQDKLNTLILDDLGMVWHFLAPNAMQTTPINGAGNTIENANGVAARFSSNGDIEVFISAKDNHIYIFSFSEDNPFNVNGSVFAGDGQPLLIDGAASDASFNNPMGLAIGGTPDQPQLIIADSGNNAIRGIYLEP